MSNLREYKGFVNGQKVKISGLISVVITLVAFSAEAASKFFEIKNHIEIASAWRLIAEIDGAKKYCHALISPYKTRQISGVVAKPLFVFSYRGKDSFSMSVSTDTALNANEGAIVYANDSKYALQTNLPGKRIDNAITYSVLQDVRLVNDLLTGDPIFKIKLSGKNDEVSIHYFSAVGLKEILLHFNQYCETVEIP